MGRVPLGVKGITAEAAIAELSMRGLPTLELFEEVAKRLRPVVQYTAGCWKPTDPDTLLFTGFAIEDPAPGMLRSVCWRFVDNELFEPDFAKFGDLARKRRPVTTLHEATHGEPERSARYRRIHRELGFGAELRAVFRTGRAVWGSVALVRAQGDPDFSRDEIAFVTRISDHLAFGLRLALLHDAEEAASGIRSPGMIVLREDLSVESMTTQAEDWLAEFPADRRTGLELPAVLYAVARRARKQGSDGASSLPAAARVQLTSAGWLVVHAAPLEEAGADRRTAVVLVPAGPAETTPLRLELYGLTAREREVTRLLVRGLSTDEIARALYISRHTVKDHVKAIYAKAEVTSRPELTARLFHDHHLPAIAAGGLREFAPS